MNKKIPVNAKKGPSRDDQIMDKFTVIKNARMVSTMSSLLLANAPRELR